MEKAVPVTFSGVYTSPLHEYVNGIVLDDRSFLFVKHDGQRYGWVHAKTAADTRGASSVHVRYLGPWDSKHNTLSLHELCALFRCGTPLTKHDLEVRIRDSYRAQNHADIEWYSTAYEALYGRPALDAILVTIAAGDG